MRGGRMSEKEPDFENWIKMDEIMAEDTKAKLEKEQPGDRNDVSSSTMWAIAAMVVGVCCVAGSLSGWIAWLFS